MTKSTTSTIPGLSFDALGEFGAAGASQETIQTLVTAHWADRGDAWVYAEADDGIVWGALRKGKLVTSGDVAEEAPVEGLDWAAVRRPLRDRTTRVLRIFNERAELRAWRIAEGHLRAVLITDHETGSGGTRNAAYLLLGAERGGDRATVRASGVTFTLLQNERGEAALVPADAGAAGTAVVLRARLHRACDAHGQWVLRSARWLDLDVCAHNELSESAADTSEE